MTDDDRVLLIDASVMITLAEIGHVELLRDLDGQGCLPRAVADELMEDPARSWVAESTRPAWIVLLDPVPVDAANRAAWQLGMTPSAEREDPSDISGDVALLAHALEMGDSVVITDDKPLRKTCRALGIELSGSIGVLVVAVEQGTLEAAEAKDALEAMDEVGARLSARLFRTAERLIDHAAE